MFHFKVDTEILVLVQRKRILLDKTMSILIACLLDNVLMLQGIKQ